MGLPTWRGHGNIINKYTNSFDSLNHPHTKHHPLNPQCTILTRTTQSPNHPMSTQHHTHTQINRLTLTLVHRQPPTQPSDTSCSVTFILQIHAGGGVMIRGVTHPPHMYHEIITHAYTYPVPLQHTPLKYSTQVHRTSVRI